MISGLGFIGSVGVSRYVTRHPTGVEEETSVLDKARALIGLEAAETVDAQTLEAQHKGDSVDASDGDETPAQPVHESYQSEVGVEVTEADERAGHEGETTEHHEDTEGSAGISAAEGESDDR